MKDTNPSSGYKIRFIDCDPLGHLTNSRYIDYMLNAREDHVNQYYDLDYQEMAEQTGGTWVTLQNQIAYLKEVRYGQRVQIDSKLIAFTEKTARVEIQMRDEASGRIHALLWTEVIYFDLRSRKAVGQPAEIVDRFAPLLMPLDQKNFEERVLYIRNQR